MNTLVFCEHQANIGEQTFLGRLINNRAVTIPTIIIC